ncbi:MAG: hypothetical protein Q9187_008216 [Circinaria calcarea]
MTAPRVASRCLRGVRTRPITCNSRPIFKKTRFASSVPETSNGSSHFSTALTGGLVGGTLVFLAGYSYYHFSGAKTLVQTAKQTKQYLGSATQKFKETTPEPNEALEYLRRSALQYAAFIPGAKGYVETAFNDLDSIRNKHGDKVDEIVKEAYNELKGITNEKGMSFETARQAWEILQKHLKAIGNLAGDAAHDILNNHPEIKEKVGGNLDQLKAMGERYGPEAKKQVDQTWDQMQDIIKSGVSVNTANKIRSLIQEKMELVQKMGDDAWSKGLEQAKPYLDKSPKVKKLIEENAEQLKQGNVGELWQKIKEATTSGDTSSVESYIKSAVDKAKQTGGSATGGLDQYLKMIPGADQIVPKLTQMQEIAQKHGKEAESLMKETVQEMQQVLQRKVGEAEKLAEKNAKK